MSVEIQSMPKRPPGSIVAEMLVGAALGAGAIWLYTNNNRELRWADAVAAGAALMFAISGVRLLMWSFDAKRLGASMAVEGESTPGEARSARWQAVILLCTAGLLAAPVAGMRGGGPAPLWCYAVVAILLAVSAVYIVGVMREGDEYQRRQMRERAWWSFMIGQSALLVYACGERLALLPKLDAWDIMVSMTVVSLLAPLLSMARRSGA